MTDLQHDPSSQDISPAERLRRVDNYLSLRGATAEQIADIHESYVRAGFIKNPHVEVHTVPASDVSNENLSDASSSKPDAFLLSRYLDKGSQHVGSVVEEFGNFIESKPAAKLALEGADFMAGPVIFGVKRVPVVEKMIDKVTGEMTDLLAGGFERAGYVGSDVQHGANGTTVILSVGIGGIVGAVKKLGKSIDFSRNTAQVAERTIETTPIPIRNAELIGADGKVISRQNPLTDALEPSVPDLSKGGVKSTPIVAGQISAVEHAGGSQVLASGPQVYAPDLSHVTGKGATVRNRAIDSIIKEDFPNLNLTHTPEYNPFLRTGIAQEGAGTQIGKTNFSSRDSLRDVIVHEELHHRWWERGIYEHHPAGSAQESRFYETIDRYKRMRGWNE